LDENCCDAFKKGGKLLKTDEMNKHKVDLSFLLNGIATTAVEPAATHFLGTRPSNEALDSPAPVLM
jgi:hypothetical protein